MKIKVAKKEFEKKSRIALAAAAKGGTMKVLNCVKITAEPFEGIKFFATDMSLGISTTADGDILESGEVLVDAKRLADFVKKMPEGIITMETEGSDVKISCAKTKLKLPMTTEQMPTMPTMNEENKVVFDQIAFKDAISGVLFAVAGNETSQALMKGVNFKFINGNVQIVALDGHRIAVKKIKVNTTWDKDFTVPADLLREVHKLLTAKTDENLMMLASEKQIMFMIEDTIVTGRLLDGEYYKVEKMISNAKQNTSVRLNKQKFMESIDRSTLFSNAISNKPVILKIGDEGLEVSISSTLGNMQETLEVEKTGNNLCIAFNPLLLMDMLRAIDEEDIHMEFGIHAKEPLIVKGAGYLYLTLPINMGT